MSRLKPQAASLYGLPQPLSGQNPSPIIAKRDPSTLDTGYAIGQNWVNTVLGTVFELVTVSAGSATWASLGTTSGSFATVTAGTFTTSTAATAISLASGNVFTGTGSNAAVGFTFTPKGTAGLTLTTGALTATNGNVVLGTAGNGLVIKSGANARIGQSTLVLGTKAVANTSVTANTRVLLSRSSKGASTAVGVLEGVVNAGVGFTINSYTPATAAVETNDISVIDWVLVESA
jgi:hypothetical protein